MPKIEVYADGSATTADKAGGWGSVILVDGAFHKELSGHLESATNNDAELAAALHGLDYISNHMALASNSEVYLISDSEIVLNWANGTFRFKQFEKIHLYDKLRNLVKQLSVKTKWVRGHSGDIWNERCDKLANLARKGIIGEDLDKSGPNMNTRIGSKKTGIVCLWHGDILKVIDLETNVIEDYNRVAHGKRGSHIQIREEKDR